MTADEIRREVGNQATFLREIAAQLAELNETLRGVILASAGAELEKREAAAKEILSTREHLEDCGPDCFRMLIGYDQDGGSEWREVHVGANCRRLNLFERGQGSNASSSR